MEKNEGAFIYIIEYTDIQMHIYKYIGLKNDQTTLYANEV